MTKSTITREENIQAVFDLKAGYTLGLADVEILKRVARMALAAMDSEAKEPISFDEWSRKCALQITLCHSDFREKAQYIWDSARATHQPAPVVPEDVLDALQKVARIRLDLNGFDGDRRGIADCLGDAEEALIEVVNRRAAILQELQKSAGTANNCRSNKNVQDLQDESRCSNSPVIPEGYVMVPKEPTEQMYDAGDRQMATKQVWDAMLAAAPQPQNAPQNIPEIIPGWIPVSERLPEKNQSVLISVNFDSSLVDPLICTARYTGTTFRRGEATVKPGSGIEEVTHWMPLPAGPKEEK